jgi:hypothetical protein
MTPLQPVQFIQGGLMESTDAVLTPFLATEKPGWTTHLVIRLHCSIRTRLQQLGLLESASQQARTTHLSYGA